MASKTYKPTISKTEFDKAASKLRAALKRKFDEAEDDNAKPPLRASTKGAFDHVPDLDSKTVAKWSATVKKALVSPLRDRFSIDGWHALNDLAKTAGRMSGRVTPGDDAARAMSVLLRKITGFSGLVHENMYRFTGWRFLSIGRHLERGLHMARLLGHFSGPDAPDGALDMLIEIGDSVMTHRRR